MSRRFLGKSLLLVCCLSVLLGPANLMAQKSTSQATGLPSGTQRQVPTMTTPQGLTTSEAPRPAVQEIAVGTGMQVDQASYMLTANDVIEVSLFGAPEMTQRVRIDSNGEVYLALVEKFRIAGLTVEAARAHIEQQLQAGGFVRRPHVSIMLLEFASGVVVMGEVVHPGIFPVPGMRRLFDVMTLAGGPTPYAGKAVTITRQKTGTQDTILLSRDPAANLLNNVPVYTGDTVSVARAGVVYVVGEVAQPNSLLMEETDSFTALKALAMARGGTKMAALNRAMIVRRTPQGVQTLPVQLKSIMMAKSPDVALQRDDILFVPSSAAKIAAYRAAEMAISIASAMAIWNVQH